MEGFDLNKLVRESVLKLQPYSSARDEYVSDGSEMIFLDANENPFDNGVNRYPDPYQRSLKSLLAKQKGVSENQVLLGNGSDEVLDLIYRAFCEPNQDNIITLPPTYGMYKVLAGINAVKNKEVLLTNDFEPNVDEILMAVDIKTKLLFICSPNNPTGNAFKEEAVEKLLKSFQGLVVIDEAYIDFSKDESWLSKLDNYPNLIVTQTLSKAYGLAGIRLGICYASEEIIGVLNKIKPPYNVNQLTQQRALQRVLNQDLVNKEVQQILDERDELINALNGLEFVKELYPTDANFVLAKVDDANKRYQQLLDKQVVVRNRSTQPLCENTLRFTVGTPEENKKLIAILKELN
ncbi:histidinol-phosphate transaminase [Muricauda ruestringensis]|uniref:Histidinol-phosphate aminotransferase n=1 Tax=Flagellimonas aurea TaxID=2915619 RepID=A0ABS3G126_9FLAO|nr:histidinol-phosphate transaminase [Allomuricauda aurea]MAO16726.1 histidinol-phosphate transaminase [Allomuricauda sp.]MBC71431.1 histidinol-phosphate transaminase [Allomuricauda sp.]MBO0353104.1 histidinol-phosphate transaminase [Allomuricauda aurea]|tara:strand:+ start:235 stop:1281 length:1047 start_codon:yes stop_codon:yes gene_type:complete